MTTTCGSEWKFQLFWNGLDYVNPWNFNEKKIAVNLHQTNLIQINKVIYWVSYNLIKSTDLRNMNSFRYDKNINESKNKEEKK